MQITSLQNSDDLYGKILSIRDEVANSVKEEAKKVKSSIASSQNPNAEIFLLAKQGFNKLQNKVQLELSENSSSFILESYIKSCESYFFSPDANPTSLRQELKEIIL